MKQLLLFGFLAWLTFLINAQEADTTLETNDSLGYEVIDNEQVEIKTDEIVKEGQKDTTNFVVGDSEILIIEDKDEDETSLIIKEDKNKEEEDNFLIEEDNEKPGKKYKFKGHWAGFEFGLNNYVDKNNSISRTPENEFMDLNTSRSWNINLNFAQYSVPLHSNRFGMVTGMGLEWSNYHFSNSNTIQKLDGKIQADTLNISSSPKKNRFQSTYLTIPILFEIQLLDGKRKNRIYFAGGVIGGLKLFSNTKVVYTNNGSKQKLKRKEDYYLQPFRYAVTGRAGYKMVKVYANYYLSSLFIENRGPELYPVAAGLAITF